MDSTQLNAYSQISKYYKSFSGTDTLAFILMPGSTPVVLGSLTTISYSMFRNKKPVINIGRTNINGVTRGSRIFAGTMVFTLINQHWLKELQDQLEWLREFEELKVDELPLFDIMIVSANEYGNYVSMYIFGIDFTDEAQTISVEDLFTENVFSFVARDISVFKSQDVVGNNMRGKGGNGSTLNSFTQKLFVLDSSMITLNEIGRLEAEFTKAKMSANLIKSATLQPLARTLYYSSSKLMIGNDVAKVQEMLNATKLATTLDINGIFDSDMDKAVREYQSNQGLPIDGVITDKLYNMLLNQTKIITQKVGLVMNKFGAYVYKEPYIGADIVDVKEYKSQIPITKLLIGYDEVQKFYQTDTGFVTIEDIYSSYYTGGIMEFPIIQYGDKNHYVTMVQTALASIFKDYYAITGEYDYQTVEKIKQLQSENGFEPNGVVTNDIWLLLQSMAGGIVQEVSQDNFKIEFNLVPGIYDMKPIDTFENIKLFTVKVSCDNYIDIKVTAICLYDSNDSEVFTSNIKVKGQQIITLETLRNAFVYNPKYGKQPKTIEYIVYPYNKKPYKWTINYAKE